MNPPPLTTTLIDAAVDLFGQVGRGGRLPVSGQSMLPTLQPGESLAIEFAPGELQLGDLLVFRQGGELVVHRYLGGARMPDGAPALRTRGDHAISLDPPLRREDVKGRVLAVEHDGRWLDLRSPAARRYGRAVAVHDLAWAAAGVAGRTLDSWFGFAVGRGPIWRLSSRLDRALLHRAHRLLFLRMHVEAATPDF